MIAVETWQDVNQRLLVAALNRVRALLERHAATTRRIAQESDATAASDAEHQSSSPIAAFAGTSALERLCAAFSLSEFERDVLLVCAGMELNAAFPALCADAHGDAHRPYPTFGLALAAFPAAHWSALSPVSPLRRWHLIELLPSDALTQAPLRIDERVLHFLAGVPHLDQRLQGVAEPIAVSDELPSSYHTLAARLASLWSRLGIAPSLELCGDDAGARRAIAASACEAAGLRLHALRAASIPEGVRDRELLARLWEREAALASSALLVETDDFDLQGHGGGAAAFIDGVQALVIVSGRQPLRLRRRSVVRFDIPKVSAAEQRRMWEHGLGDAAAILNGQIESVVAQFRLGMEGIRAASAQVLAHLPEKPPGSLLWEACRIHARPRLSDLAQSIEPAAGWDDLVLPAVQTQTLREIAAHVRHRSTVHNTWGFARTGARGLAISALFAGASGTGKTMAAEVLAAELRLDLYRIDLSQVVSKYIGETEKNLRRVFDAAEEGAAVLLFDEADALFGKRSEVKDSHDRYANIEISYLLQRMEVYRGLAILTTNMRRALDSSFLRRLRFVVEFPYPDTAQRAEIWRRIFPHETPTEGLDVERLARLNVAGGHIRNIALYAAFLAADDSGPVRMSHVLRAARAEYAKLERPLTDAEIGGWL